MKLLQRRKYIFLLAILGLVIDVGMIFLVAPNVFTIGLFLLIFTFSIYALFFVVFKRKRHAFLSTIGLVLILILRILHLRHWGFLVAVAVGLVLVELYLHKKTSRK